MSAHHRPLDDSDVALIHTIRSTPSLYDHRHGDFRLSQRKEEDWAKVAETLNISSPDARRRWTCLRDRYSRELKQMRLHPNSEFGHNDFFRQMDFLREFVRKRRERSRRDDTPTSWLKTEVRAPKLKARPEPDTLIEQELDESQVYDECDHNYDADAKLEVQTTQSESYSVLVEADDGDGHDSYEEYMADSESADQKVLPTMQPSPSLVTVHTEAPTTGTVCTAGVSPSDAGHSQADIDYMVCVPNVRVEREHLPPIKPEASPGFEAVTAPTATSASNETEDDFFCKSVAAYLRQLSRRHKIKAKVEMFQVLEKYILLEESATAPGTSHNG
ncbi:uncharacterized protein hng1 [Drosophila virilis]|uniref:MADF domain-containing protein n=1 Tax=Drosophila virilis TaxID=7244 RepID=B4LMQ8_DROVI|nr:uncharacterized protein LOC6626449 [Drosophila virilis]EDW60999.1 uncharacterized protein Dvir_GJ20543 [Drosophila virilis]